MVTGSLQKSRAATANQEHPKTDGPEGPWVVLRVWQPVMDSNHRMPESESGALPLG